MFAKIPSFALKGIEGVLIDVEVDLCFKTPKFLIVGLPDTAIREAQYRVKTAINNSGYCFPYQRILINLAPADLKKQGPQYDLPITIGLLAASEQIPLDKLSGIAFVGELALDGSVRAVKGVISMVEAAYKGGIKKIVVPAENAAEASLPGFLEVYSVHNLAETIQFLTGAKEKIPFQNPPSPKTANPDLDYREIVGQEYSKRAMLVAAAGGHHALMVGPPGSGKTMLAQRIPTILPILDLDKAMETTRIYSMSGLLLPGQGLVRIPPFRAPHHTVSHIGMAGGGSNPKPGELSLAHNGVLFLDELAEFPRNALEVLRQPLENGHVIIARAKETVSYPCQFLLIAAMNPCPCGYLGDRVHTCRCDSFSIARYRRRISGPLLDRFDIQLAVSPIHYQDLISEPQGVDSKTMYERVIQCREIQKNRLQPYGLSFNREIPPSLLPHYCKVDEIGEAILKKAMKQRGFSARAYHKILRMARTLADLDACEKIEAAHLCEAIQYRCLPDWGEGRGREN